MNGEIITAGEVGQMADGRIRQLAESKDEGQSEASLERAKLALRWDALNYLIEKRLIRAEAARLKISEDALIEKEIDELIPEVPLETVDAFVAANKARMPLIQSLSRTELVSQVRGYLNVQSERILRAVFIQRLSAQYGVKTYLDPLRTDVATAGYPVRGPATAPVTIVEFSDFECRDCAQLAVNLRALQDANGEKVRIVYRQFPLAHMNAHAQKAAEASLCAADQQRFWEFHDRMFANPAKLTVEDLKAGAAAMKLDVAAFNECLASGRHVADIDKDIDAGYAAGVFSAPTFFVNGRMFFGNRARPEIQQVIDEEIQRAARQ